MDTKPTELVTTGSTLRKIHRRSSDAFLRDQAEEAYQRWAEEQRRTDAFLDGSLKVQYFIAALAVGALMWIALIHFARPTLHTLAHLLHIF